ncbi:hypothetical protein F4818DRAFT_439922 [Hypoxylon cercidicola]|nr:hypothetical protein F4818DRAFT_439922 [Hypoxylon cercidicola]
MYQSALTLLTGLAAVSTAAILPHIVTGTGPKGFLTVDDSPKGSQHGALAVANDGFSSCLALRSQDTTATVSDCQAVINDIRATGGAISVPAGFCLNWYEGGCLGRVCGGTDLEQYSGDSSWIADQMTSSILDSCISQGKSGAAADCQDVGGTCGSYHFKLQTNVGGM